MQRKSAIATEVHKWHNAKTNICMGHEGSESRVFSLVGKVLFSSYQPGGRSLGWRGEGVQHPDSLVDKAVGEYGGAEIETPVPSSRGQDAEQIVSGVACIAYNYDCFAGGAGGVYVFQGGEWCTNDPSSCVHYALQGSPVVVSAAPAPQSATAGKNTLNGSLVEHGHDEW